MRTPPPKRKAAFFFLRYDIVVNNPEPMALPNWGNGTSNKAHFMVDFRYPN